MTTSIILQNMAVEFLININTFPQEIKYNKPKWFDFAHYPEPVEACKYKEFHNFDF